MTNPFDNDNGRAHTRHQEVKPQVHENVVVQVGQDVLRVLAIVALHVLHVLEEAFTPTGFRVPWFVRNGRWWAPQERVFTSRGGNEVQQGLNTGHGCKHLAGGGCFLDGMMSRVGFVRLVRLAHSHVHNDSRPHKATKPVQKVHPVHHIPSVVEPARASIETAVPWTLTLRPTLCVHTLGLAIGVGVVRAHVEAVHLGTEPVLRQDRVHPAARHGVASKERTVASLVRGNVGVVEQAVMQRVKLRVVTRATRLQHGAEFVLGAKRVHERPGFRTKLQNTLVGTEIVENVLKRHKTRRVVVHKVTEIGPGHIVLVRLHTVVLHRIHVPVLHAEAIVLRLKFIVGNLKVPLVMAKRLFVKRVHLQRVVLENGRGTNVLERDARHPRDNGQTLVVKELLGVEVVGERRWGQPRKLLFLEIHEGHGPLNVYIVLACLVQLGTRRAAHGLPQTFTTFSGTKLEVHAGQRPHALGAPCWSHGRYLTKPFGHQQWVVIAGRRLQGFFRLDAVQKHPHDFNHDVLGQPHAWATKAVPRVVGRPFGVVGFKGKGSVAIRLHRRLVRAVIGIVLPQGETPNRVHPVRAARVECVGCHKVRRVKVSGHTVVRLDKLVAHSDLLDVRFARLGVRVRGVHHGRLVGKNVRVAKTTTGPQKLEDKCPVVVTELLAQVHVVPQSLQHVLGIGRDIADTDGGGQWHVLHEVGHTRGVVPQANLGPHKVPHRARLKVTKQMQTKLVEGFLEFRVVALHACAVDVGGTALHALQLHPSPGKRIGMQSRDRLARPPQHGVLVRDGGNVVRNDLEVLTPVHHRLNARLGKSRLVRERFIKQRTHVLWSAVKRRHQRSTVRLVEFVRVRHLVIVTPAHKRHVAVAVFDENGLEWSKTRRLEPSQFILFHCVVAPVFMSDIVHPLVAVHAVDHLSQCFKVEAGIFCFVNNVLGRLEFAKLLLLNVLGKPVVAVQRLGHECGKFKVIDPLVGRAQHGTATRACLHLLVPRRDIRHGGHALAPLKLVFQKRVVGRDGKRARECIHLVKRTVVHNIEHVGLSPPYHGLAVGIEAPFGVHPRSKCLDVTIVTERQRVVARMTRHLHVFGGHGDIVRDCPNQQGCADTRRRINVHKPNGNVGLPHHRKGQRHGRGVNRRWQQRQEREHSCRVGHPAAKTATMVRLNVGTEVRTHNTSL
eukprot:m.10938 g.10938  ORF g.10938 m.10938 type:complete len:1171 (+) comp2795_c0_seq1:1486-4998(+)